MRIASIDYGKNTGVVIFDIANTPGKKTVLTEYLKVTYIDDWAGVLGIIDASRSSTAILEKCPAFGTPMYVNVFSKLELGLRCLGFREGVNDPIHKKLVLIPPARWKPFMKSRKAMLEQFGTYETQHEKDAMLMLLYYVITQFSPYGILEYAK